ncbi:thiamine pyrophosphate-binding protein [Paenarthrobacter sp. NPDC089989]|uniref:thiamine pyrophosphate-binding protein n=1 Tax=unclassified Paenarthrobacter TaxID=2634190 RepID=UPI00381B4664
MIVDYLIREGVEYVFTIPGHGNTALLDAFVDRKDEITVLPAMHEQGAVHMAAAQYRAAGKIAAACVSIGPGATNTLTALAGAYTDSVPVLLLTGGVHTYMVGRGTFQEIDRPHGSNFPRMAEPVVKRWWQPSRVDQLGFTLSQAFSAMTEGRPGPVLIDVPQDVQAESAVWEPPTPVCSARKSRPFGDPAAVAAAAKLLATAERPVILAGGGVILSEASPALAKVAEFLGAPVIHSYQGKGAFPADHDLYAGGCGDIGTDAGNAMARSADVLLAVGCRFTDRVSSSYRPGITFDIPGGTRLIHVDIDAFEIGKNYPAEIGINGDAKAVLESLEKTLSSEHEPRDYRSSAQYAELTELRAGWEIKLDPARSDDQQPVTVSRALAEMAAALPRDTILVTDTGYCADQAFNEFPVYEPRHNIVSGAMSEMGFAIPTAIGARLARPEAPVLAFVGDGSLLQTGTELAVAAMLDLPLVVLALNNGGWDSVRDTQLLQHGSDRHLATDFREIGATPYFADLCGLAKSLGCEAERVDDPAEIGTALKRAFEARRPVLIEVRSANEIPRTMMQQTGWWDVTIPEYLTDSRATYEEKRGF